MTRKWLGPTLCLATLLITTLAATGTLLTRGASCGHDFDFHLVSWMEVANAWHNGLVYPHWAASPNYGAGEPRFVFYPPASWMLGAMLGSIFGWSASAWWFTAICLLCAGLAMQRLAREFLPPHVAVAAACLYIANPYMLFVAYERTAYGELMASALLPLLFAFSLRTEAPIAATAVTIAGIWLVNAPSGVMACYALLWIALLRLASDRAWRAPLRLGGATLLGLGLAAFYLVPAAWQQRWVDIVRAIGPGMRFQDSFLFHHTGESFHDGVLHTASILACMLLAFGFTSLLLWRGALRPRRLLWLASLIPLILFLLLPLSAPLWNHAPRLGYVQFPWRWLLVLAPVVALSVAGGLGRRLRPVWLIVGVVLLCTASIAYYIRHFHQHCDEEDVVSAQVALMHDESGEEGTDEYTPRNDDNAEVTQDMPPVRVLVKADGEEPNSGKEINPEWTADADAERHATISVQHWSSEQRVVNVDTPAAGFAVFRLMDYPAWTVRRDGAALTVRPRRDDGLLTVPVPQGRSHIEIRWRTTKDVWIGRILSLLAVCVWIFAWYRERRAHDVLTMPFVP